jgi:hypothetical protein
MREMRVRKIAVATACLLVAALAPVSAAQAGPPPITYGDTFTLAADSLMYDSHISGNQDWAMSFKAVASGLPSSAMVVTNNVVPLDVRVYSGDYLAGNGTLIASKTGAPTSVVDDASVVNGKDYAYTLSPLTPQSVLLKDSTYFLVVTVPFQTVVGVRYAPNLAGVSSLKIGQAGAFSWTYTDAFYKLSGRVSVQLDTDAPTGSAAFTTAPTGDNGWYTAYPTAHFTCSDIGLGVAFCPADQTATQDGNFTPSGTVVDLVGLSTLITGPTAKIDTAAPGLVAAFDGSLGLNGWYTTLGTLQSQCTDATSGVAQCVSPAAVADGTYTLQAKAVDNAGNVTTKDVDLKVDTTAPTLSGAFNGTLGTNGWYKTLGTVVTECTDATSGVANCPTAVVETDGVYAFDITASDNAGNTNKQTFDVKVDTTAPELTAAYNGTLGLNGWYVTLGTLQSECTDETSGVADCQSPVVDADGTFTLTARAIDNAGNETTKDVDLKVDSTPPVLDAVYNGDLGNNGWYTSLGTLDSQCTDATSGVADCQSIEVTTEGAHALKPVAHDNAGNTTTGTFEVDVDTQAPSVAIAGVSSGAVLTAGKTSAVKCVANDSTSGVDSCTLKVTPALTVVGKHTAVATARDKAGNTSTRSVTFSTAPVITGLPAAGTVLRAGTYVTFTYTLRDAKGSLVDGTVAYLKPMAGSAKGAAVNHAKRISTGKYQVRLYLAPSMAKSKTWTFGVTVGGRTFTRTYQVR